MGNTWVKGALREKWVWQITQWDGLATLDLVVPDGLDRSSM